MKANDGVCYGNEIDFASTIYRTSRMSNDVIRPDAFQVGEWISVRDRMPTPDQTVLIYVNCGPYSLRTVGVLRTDGWDIVNEGCNEYGEINLGIVPISDLNLDIEVKAWMPLPAPPDM